MKFIELLDWAMVAMLTGVAAMVWGIILLGTVIDINIREFIRKFFNAFDYGLTRGSMLIALWVFIGLVHNLVSFMHAQNHLIAGIMDALESIAASMPQGVGT